MKMKIVYTRHARRRMKWRKITASEIEFAINAPDMVEDTEKNRYNAYKEIKGKLLKVTYRKSDDEEQIISALWKGE